MRALGHTTQPARHAYIRLNVIGWNSGGRTGRSRRVGSGRGAGVTGAGFGERLERMNFSLEMAFW